MPNKTETILVAICVTLLGGCPEPADEDPEPQAPEPIGDELLRIEGTWGLPACSSSHLYREGREVQYQCFDADGVFSWENRGTLSPEAAATLDAELSAADLDDTEPVNYMGLCDAADAQGTVSLWVGERKVSFAPFCLFRGILPLYEEAEAIKTDVAECRESSERLVSLDPGCRAY